MKPLEANLALALILLAGTLSPSAAKPSKLPRQLIAAVMKDVCSASCSEDQRTDYRRNIKFELHDLNGDGIPEFFVYVDHPDWCGNHFNCDYSVFQRGRNGYRLIASGHPALRTTNTVTNGYRDLEGRHDIGVCQLRNGTQGRDVFVAVLHYTGTEYKSTELGEQCLKDLPVPAFRVGRVKQDRWMRAESTGF
jgi:hypothetical protein